MAKNLKSNTLRIRCPHCSHEIVVGFYVDAVARRRTGPSRRSSDFVYRGPKAYDPGREIDDWIIEKGEKQSFTQLARLLETRGVPTARGNLSWDKAQARRLYHYALSRRVERQAKENPE